MRKFYAPFVEGRNLRQNFIDLDAHICDICISQADMIVKDDEASKESSDFIVDLRPPLEIKNFLTNM